MKIIGTKYKTTRFSYEIYEVGIVKETNSSIWIPPEDLDGNSLPASRVAKCKDMISYHPTMQSAVASNRGRAERAIKKHQTSIDKAEEFLTSTQNYLK